MTQKTGKIKKIYALKSYVDFTLVISWILLKLRKLSRRPDKK
jgi:hypothetical protein